MNLLMQKITLTKMLTVPKKVSPPKFWQMSNKTETEKTVTVYSLKEIIHSPHFIDSS